MRTAKINFPEEKTKSLQNKIFILLIMIPEIANLMAT